MRMSVKIPSPLAIRSLDEFNVVSRMRALARVIAAIDLEAERMMRAVGSSPRERWTVTVRAIHDAVRDRIGRSLIRLQLSSDDAITIAELMVDRAASSREARGKWEVVLMWMLSSGFERVSRMSQGQLSAIDLAQRDLERLSKLVDLRRMRRAEVSFGDLLRMLRPQARA